ncbi:MAG: site-specific DNA-methyltransferase [Methylotenera sp.]|nr:site-specific DNA-methyltransferase [Methylotenera sp.]
MTNMIDNTMPAPLALIQTTDGNAERLATLKQLYPDLFTNEGKLNLTELQKLADPSSVNETEKFEFKWFGKSQAKRNAFSPTNASLVYDEGRSVNPEQGEHIIIEGENLEVLKLLKQGYRERIKCIYIDPPYNTGKDFVYSDNFTQDKKAYWQDNGTVDAGVKVDTHTESDGRYHSHWLNMMFSRLLLARELLRDDGVIFISIDDNEMHHLRKLCDEVFGEDNFVADFIWQHRKSSQNDVDVSLSHNHTICFSKDREVFQLNALEIKDEKFSNLDNDPRGDWVADPLDAPNIRPNLTYPITNPSTGEQHLPPSGRHWRFSQEKFANALIEKRIIFGKTGKGRPQYKRFKSEAEEKGTNPFTVWTEMGTATEGTKELMKIFGGLKIFDTPKPVRLLNEILKLSTSKESIVLDFFAGSGTACHAVMELNHADGGKRQCISVQLPEQTDEKSEAYKAGYKKISDITIARNKKVVEKLQAEGHSTGFKVFKLTPSHFPRAQFTPDPNADEATNQANLQAYINEKERQLFNSYDEAHLLTEVLIKRGFKLNHTTTPAAEFTQNKVLWVTDDEKQAHVCLDAKLEDATVNHLMTNPNKHFICLERALDTTKKWNLKHAMGNFFFAF